MAGFSLGGNTNTSDHHHHHHHQTIQQGATQQQGLQAETLFQLYSGNRNQQEITSSRGFELWQHQQQQQQIQRQEQQHQQQHNLYSSTGGGSSLLAFSNELSMRGGHSSGSMSCQDCGNQAKKDCIHLRCRTCCKSRGFQCSTHIKSTWVPAAKRRERQQHLAEAAAIHQQQQQSTERLRIGGEATKRPREMMTVTTTTASSGGGAMDAGAVSFPSEVSSQAIFRCVRVSPIDDQDEEFAYQTAVNIGGHVFKGILYDHGPDSHHPSTPTTHHNVESLSSSGNVVAPAAIATANNVAAIATANVAALASNSAPTSVSTSNPVVDPNSLYPTPLSAFMAGTQFFPHHPRPN